MKFVFRVLMALTFLSLSQQLFAQYDTTRINIYFDTGADSLKRVEAPKLDKLALRLKLEKTYFLDLRGHTDSRGSVAYNQALSERRMETVRQYLRKWKIPNRRMQKSAWSELRPVASNGDSLGMQLNRRVEIVLIIPSKEQPIAEEEEEPEVEEEIAETNPSQLPPVVDPSTPEGKILEKFGSTWDKSFDPVAFDEQVEGTVPHEDSTLNESSTAISSDGYVIKRNPKKDPADSSQVEGSATTQDSLQIVDGVTLAEGQSSKADMGDGAFAGAGKTLVVMDWTRSMYHYGTKVYEWHLRNLDRSSIRYLAFFNDGDKKATEQKRIGETGGVYYNSTVDDISSVTSLMDDVAKNGTGGDFPENYIEAIIKAEARFPDADTVVLIADNRACIRDWELIEQLPKKPIKIILCGVSPTAKAINYHYINLAAYTGGTLHVMGKEIKQLSMKNNQITPAPPRDTTIIMPKMKGKLRDVEKERRRLEKKYQSRSLPPVTIVDGNEYLMPSRGDEIVVDDVTFKVGKANCVKYDFRRKAEITVKPTFTGGQKLRRGLKVAGRVTVFIVTLPVTLPMSLVMGGGGVPVPLQ